MKYPLIIIFIVLTIPSFGQEIEKIIFTSQQADEPPTKRGRPKYTIEFVRQADGDFVASDFLENKRRMKLKNKTTIKKEQIEKITEWEKREKRTFSQSDLGIDITSLEAGSYNYKLNFNLPTDLIVSVDSFQFCQNYKMTKCISTGGETITVTTIDRMSRKKEFIFDSDDIEIGNFRLIEYILCYTLLKDKLPDEIPYHEFFSKDKLNEIVLNYQMTVECEGYYYKEYTDKNPKITSKERRMMNGWDFVEYMEQRNKNE